MLEEFSGNTIGITELKWIGKISNCEEYYNNLTKCHSFVINKKKGQFKFKDKMLTGNEPMCPGEMISYFENCRKGNI